MDSARGVDVRRLGRDIDETRADISRVASELRWKAEEAMHWQTYVARYPAAILGAAALLGVAVGRRIARRWQEDPERESGEVWTPAASASLPTRILTPLEGAPDRFAAVSASWQRLASRLEGLVNRMIDDVADAAERAVVPAVVGGVQAFLENRVSHPSHRPIPRDGRPTRAAEGGD